MYSTIKSKLEENLKVCNEWGHMITIIYITLPDNNCHNYSNSGAFCA